MDFFASTPSAAASGLAAAAGFDDADVSRFLLETTGSDDGRFFQLGKEDSYIHDAFPSSPSRLSPGSQLYPYTHQLEEQGEEAVRDQDAAAYPFADRCFDDSNLALVSCFSSASPSSMSSGFSSGCASDDDVSTFTQQTLAPASSREFPRSSFTSSSCSAKIVPISAQIPGGAQILPLVDAQNSVVDQFQLPFADGEEMSVQPSSQEQQQHQQQQRLPEPPLDELPLDDLPLPAMFDGLAPSVLVAAQFAAEQALGPDPIGPHGDVMVTGTDTITGASESAGIALEEGTLPTFASPVPWSPEGSDVTAVAGLSDSSAPASPLVEPTAAAASASSPKRSKKRSKSEKSSKEEAKNRKRKSSSSSSSVAASSSASASASVSASPVAAPSSNDFAASSSLFPPIKMEDVIPALDEGPDLPADTSLNLNNSALAQLSSKQLEQYCVRVSAVRKLTSEEEKMLKRQRRLIKNRESAQLSRLRKKAYVGTLEDEITKLRDDKASLASHVEQLSRCNSLLQADIDQLAALLVAAGGVVPQLSSHNALATIGSTDSNASSTNSSAAASPAQSQSDEASDEPPSKVRKSHHVGPRQARSAGVALLLVLFTFGLIFNTNTREDVPAAPADQLAVSAATVVPATRAGGRVLSEYSGAGALPSLVDSSAKLARTPLPGSKRVFDVMPGTSASGAASVAVSSNLPDGGRGVIGDEVSSKRARTVSNSVPNTAHHSDGSAVVLANGNRASGSTSRTIQPALEIPSNATASQYMTAVQNYVSSPDDRVHSKERDQAFVFCPEAQALSPLPPLDGSVDDPMVAILLPSSVLHNNDPSVAPSLLQLQCQVVDYYTWPLRTQQAVAVGNVSDAALAERASTDP